MRRSSNWFHCLPPGPGAVVPVELSGTHSCVSVYDGCHADTVYSVAWGRGDDPWTFASVSYDGRVAIEKVPRAEKYRILL